jgi:hypothetical protein
MAQRSAEAKKQKISHGLTLTFNEPEENAAVADLFKWTELFSILVKTWGIVGCFDVSFRPEEAPSKRTMKYVAWWEAEQYKFEFVVQISRLRTRYSDASILQFLSECEEAFRSKAIELSRSSEQYPFGLALLKVLKTESSIWQMQRDILVLRSEVHRQQLGSFFESGVKLSKRQKREARESKNKLKPPRQEQGLKLSPNAAHSGGRFMTVTKLSDGRSVCKRFNDNRGCSQGDSCTLAHACDVLLQTNKPCAANHTRSDHRDQHGKAKPR